MATLNGPKWRIEGVSALIFDKDGTLIDSHLYWGEIVARRAAAVCGRYGLAPARQDEICASMGFDVASKRLRPEGPVALVSRGEVIKAVISQLRAIGVPAVPAELEEVFGKVAADFNPELMRYISLLPGAEVLVRRAWEAGVKLALVTSDSAVSTERILDHTGLRGCFECVVGRETLAGDKSSGLPARKALQDMGVAGGEVVAVGDAPVDAEMAAKAGLRAAVLVASGQVPASVLTSCSPYVTGTLEDIEVLT